MAFRSRTVLSRCSTKPLPKPAAAANGINEDPANPTVEVTGHPSDDDGDIVPMKKKKRKKKKKEEEEERSSAKQNSSASTSASASSSSSSRLQHEQREQPTGFRVGSRRRRRGSGASRCVGEAEQVQDLGLSLGMSVAVVMSEVLERQNTSEVIPAARLSMICSLAVKESIANVYGDRFDRFVTNFESSFHSTLNTLRSISGEMSHEQNSPPSTSHVENIGIEDRPTRSSSKHVRTTMGFSASTSCTENLGSEDCLIPVSSRNTNPPEEVPEHQITGCLDNQISIYGQMSEELSLVSVNHAAPTENLSVLERFAAEQARANKLKEVELGLTLKQMELKKMQLNLNYDANSLTRTKISMGIMDASFRKEKFKNQVEETRNAEFLNKCKDCLIVGLFVMSGCLIYGAKTFAYNRIMEMTEACTTFTKEPKSWWVPKPMDSFSSGLRMLRCHVIAISRISFGILMILAIGYSIMQRPGTTSSVMPVTYYLLLLGSLCGLAGKFCIETLGGSGYVWLLHWEPLILLHFFANVNPSAFYNFLYGPVSVSPGDKVVRMPYLIRRVTFYSAVFFFLPVLAGLMPFASPIEWKDHFVILITGSDA